MLDITTFLLLEGEGEGEGERERERGREREREKEKRDFLHMIIHVHRALLNKTKETEKKKTRKEIH